jgi:death-on-curing protein
MSRGGRKGIQSLPLIEAAIARPYCGYYRSIAHKCAALVQSMADNHGFVDGNKRTTLILVNLLLSKSRYRLGHASVAQQNVDIENLILASVKHAIEFDDVVMWFKDRLVPLPND